MAFNPLCARSVVSILPDLPEQPSVVELGNQSFKVHDKKHEELAAMLHAQGRSDAAERLQALRGLTEQRRAFTEPFYRALGFRSYTAIDVNTKYGSLIMDLNRDLRDEYGFHETFDLVTNFGTAEHIFDQRRVFENIHNLTAPGGVMLHIMPFVNWINHGFYNFHPVLYADLAAANGYTMIRLALGNKTGFEAAVDFDRDDAANGATTVRSVPPWVAASRRASRVIRGARRITSRPAVTAPSMSLTEAVTQIVPSNDAPDDPLARAIDTVMSNERGLTGSDYPVLGNVLLVTALQKHDSAPFAVPMAGRYLDHIESDALRSGYAGQNGTGSGTGS